MRIGIINWLVILSVFITGCCQSDEKVAHILNRVAHTEETLFLKELTSYKWDTVYVVGPYESFDYSSINGIPRKVRSELNVQEMLDHYYIMLFTLNNKFVSYSEVSCLIMSDLGFKGASTYTPETVIPFDVASSEVK